MNDLDTLDNNVIEDISKVLDSGSDFKLLLAHIIGIDSAGHTQHMRHKHVEDKI